VYFFYQIFESKMTGRQWTTTSSSLLLRVV